MILQQAELIITANQRQALDVQRASPSACVMAWSTFIEQLWRQAYQATSSKQWLTAFEQRIIWQRLLKQEARDGQHGALVQTCMDAWLWLTTWQVPLSALLTFATTNSEWFYHIAKRYQQQCQHRVDLAAALTQLVNDPAALKTLLPSRVVFYHFWQMTPQLRHFQHVLQQCAIDVVCLETERQASAQQWRWVADSKEAETQDMVQWLKEYSHRFPKDRFACIVPDLVNQRAALEACLQRYLPPKLLKQVHFSVGKPLADYPLVAAMDSLLTVAYQREVSLQTLSYLSRSPFWMHAESLERLISQWRSVQWATFPQEAWASVAQPALYAWWQELKHSDKHTALPSVWCERFQAIATLSGWPAVELSRQEQSVLDQLTCAYQCFANLDGLLGELSVTEALVYWRQYLQHSMFEPPAIVAPRIFFMGVFEALGSRFDHVWLMDAVFAKWPPLPSANALIPYACQQHYGLPNASTRAEQEQTLWQALSHIAPQWIVSHAARHNGESQAGLAQVTAWPYLAWQAPLTQSPLDSKVCSIPEASHGTPCLDTYAPGGTAALKAQAHCPFQAYARYRLGLRSLAIPQAVLTASERGLMVHHALFTAWQTINSQAHLLALNDAALQAIIQRSARLALAELSPWRRRLLSKTLLSLEQQRLERLLLRWLQLEAKRPPFRVEQIEKGQDVHFAGCLWRFRPDRIDVLDNGERVLIDYKTGSSAPVWQAEPLLEPQLPFYAVLSPWPVSALILAQVTAKGQKMVGLAADTLDCGPLGQIVAAADWSHQCRRWHDTIQRLAIDYLSGKADINPANGAHTCRSCDLASVCRIQASLVKSANEAIP